MSIEEFPYWFPTGPVHAITEKENVLLVGKVFERYDEASQVHEAGLQALDEFSGIVKLLWSAFEKPSISLVIREDADGSRHSHIYAPSVLAAMRAKMRVLGGPNIQTTQAQQLLSASRENHHLRMAVLLWGDPLRTWPRLYRTLEEIEAAVGKKVDDAGYCSKEQRRLFTQCANVAEVAGKDARHGSRKFESPSNPMSLREATQFISHLLERALRQYK